MCPHHKAVRKRSVINIPRKGIEKGDRINFQFRNL